MTTLAKKPGDKAQLYRNTNTFASMVLSAIRCRDLKFTDKPGAMFDSSDRTMPINTKIPTRGEWSIECEVIMDSSDAGIVAIVTAAKTNQPIDLAVYDDAYNVSGARGLHALWAVESGVDNDAKLQDGQILKLKFVPDGRYDPATQVPERLQTT